MLAMNVKHNKFTSAFNTLVDKCMVTLAQGKLTQDKPGHGNEVDR